MAAESGGIPPMYVERFVEAYRSFVAEIRLAIEDAQSHNASPGTVSLWRDRALPALEKRLAAIEGGVAAYHAGNPSALVQSADDAQGLSKNLDGYPLDFAGSEHEKKLENAQTMVILAGYWVRHSAGVP